MNAVAAYLNDVLVPQQRKYKVSETFLLYAVDTVRTQLDSLLRH